MKERVDALIIGAGIVGVACARALARRGRSVIIVERREGPGRETSSRNSGVIHAGLYYPESSLKAALCVEGRQRLYRYCEERGVDHRRTGKLVVATDEAEDEALEALMKRGLRNGAGALERWSADRLAEEEPALRGVSALSSPESGVVDAHGLLASLLADARASGADLVLASEVVAVEPSEDGVRVVARSADGELSELLATRVVSSAGLEADHVAALAGIDVDAAGLRIHPCKGQYFSLTADAPRPRCPLVYPIPVGPGLGVHLTTDLGGRITAGPDAHYVDSLDYSVDPAAASDFAESVSRYLPGVTLDHLRPDYAGIRPKLASPGETFRDFVIMEGKDVGAPGFVLLAGIESPGLTASLAIAERVLGLAF